MILIRKTLRTLLLNKQLQLICIYSLAFMIPFMLRQPQILIGSIINFLLIFSTSQFEIRKVLPLLFVPSIASLLSGTLFGTFTPYLLYIIPFIAAANLIFVFSFKYIKIRYIRILLASLLKASFLFSCAYILVNTIHIPQIFLTTMGTIQLFTALIGGFMAEIWVKKTKSL